MWLITYTIVLVICCLIYMSVHPNLSVQVKFRSTAIFLVTDGWYRSPLLYCNRVCHMM